MRILLLILICVSYKIKAQIRYDHHFKNETLYEIISELSDSYRLKFSYNPSLLKKHTISKRVRARNEAELLSAIFDDFPFKVQVADGVYLIIPSNEPIKRSTPLTGQIKDRQTGKPLAFAHVQSEKGGTITNQEGRFSLPNREDTLTLQVSYLGYKSAILDVPPSESSIDLNLEQNPYVLPEIILNSKEFNDLTGRPGFFSMNPDQFDALPALGETDVFKTIQLLPGIRATDETSSGLSVRGSSPSQNLVLMDGFTLYHLDHFFGIFSTMNPNVIDNINVFKGGFGTQYGGRISSVIDVKGKAASGNKVSGGVGANVLSINGFIEAPLGGSASIILGGRRSFTDIVNSDLYEDFLTSNRKSFIETISPEFSELELQPSFNFYDLNGKIQLRPSDKSVIDINLYASEDFYNGNLREGDDFAVFSVEDRATWSNKGASINLMQEISPLWYSEFSVSGSTYEDDSDFNVNQTILEDVIFFEDSLEANQVVGLFLNEVTSSVNDFTIKTNNEILLSPNQLVQVGAELNSITTEFDAEQLFIEIDTVDAYRDILNNTAIIGALYTNYQYSNDDITTNIGVRGSYYEPTSKWYIEPRFDIKIDLAKSFHIKGAASYHHQFINQTSLSAIQNADQFYWVMADDEAIPILRSTHFILGGDYSFNKWTFDLEYYRKNTTGVLESHLFSIPPQILAALELQGIELGGENISQGLDMFIKYRNDTYTSWLSYSIGDSQNEFAYLNEGNPYPSSFNQNHEINLVNILKLGNWELASTFIFGSGRPYTPPNRDFSEDIYDLTRANELTLPAYHRLDLSAKYSFELGQTNWETGLTLFNLYDRTNIRSRRYTKRFVFEEESNFINGDRIEIVTLDTKLLGFTPNFFLNIRF